MKYRKNVYRTLALVTQLGISMLVPIFLCTFLGVYLDDKYSTNLFIPLLILGILAGGRNTYILAKNAIKEDEE